MTQIRTWDFGEDRSTAILNRHFARLIPKGIYLGFGVTTNVPGLFLNIEEGIIITGEGVKIEEDADLPNIVQVDPGDSLIRIDLVVLQHKFVPTNDPATYSIIKGTPGGGAPSLPPDFPTGTVFTQLLATITVPAFATDIVPGDVSLEPTTNISLTTVPFATLSDISTTESDAFNAMKNPSSLNPVATIDDLSAGFLKPTESSTPNANVNFKGGRLWDRRVITFTDVSDQAIAILAPTANPRIDLLSINPDTGIFTKTVGVEAATPVPPDLPPGALGYIPVAHVLADEIGGPVVVTTADITDVRPFAHVRTPELFDLPDMDADIKDAITGAAAPDSTNVFATAADITTAVAPLGAPFVMSRLRMETALPSTIQVTVSSGLLATTHNSGFTILETIRLTSPLTAVGSGIGPGALETSGAFTSVAWYHIYLIASSTQAASPALVISSSAAEPNLGAASFDDYDIWRRLGAARTDDSSAIFLKAFNIAGETRYRDGQNRYTFPGDTAFTDDFQNAFNVLSLATRVPPTSNRGIIHAVINLSTAGTTRIIYFTDGDDTRTTTGGKEIVRISQNDHTVYNNSEVIQQLDDSQRLRVRFEGAIPEEVIFDTLGYVEDL
jgi:hypothetical protein